MLSLSSLMLSLSLNALLIVGGLQSFIKFHSILEARSTLNKLDYTLALARAQALTTQQVVRVCPKNTNAWQHGWNIENSSQQIIKQVSNSANGALQFTAFQNSPCLSILADGMTYNNGHFTYRAHSLLYNIQEQLVFNQGLRTYFVHGSNLEYSKP